MILGIFEYGGYYSDGGSSWVVDLTIAIVGAAIGSGATVFTWYKTLKQDKKKDEDRRLQFQKEKVKYLQSLIESILSGLKTQNDYYNDVSETIQKDSFNIPLLRTLPFNDIKRIVDKLNLEDYYHSYLGEFGDEKEVIKEFKQIISYLDYFILQIDLYIDSHGKSIEFDHQRKIRLKNIIEDAMDKMALMIIDAEMNKHPDFCKFLDDALLTFHQNRPEPYTLEYMHDNFVLKVKATLLEYSKTIPEANFLLMQMKNASVLFNEIKNQNTHVGSDFHQLHETFKGKIKEFEGVTERIINYGS